MDSGRPSVGFSFAEPSGIPTTKCQTFTNPLGDGIAIAELQTTATAGLRALWIKRVTAATNGALEDCVLDGTSVDATTIYFGQALSDLVTAPSGVAFAMAAGEGLRLGAAFINAAASTVTSSVTVSLRPATGAFQPAGLAFMTANSLSIAPMTTATTLNFSCAIPASESLFGATGRVQQHGDAMTAALVAGPTLFQSDPWNPETAATALQNPPLAVTSSSSVSLSCTYTNNTAQTLRFGFDYAQDEQCSLYVYYYPQTASAFAVLCN